MLSSRLRSTTGAGISTKFALQQPIIVLSLRHFEGNIRKIAGSTFDACASVSDSAVVSRFVAEVRVFHRAGVDK